MYDPMKKVHGTYRSVCVERDAINAWHLYGGTSMGHLYGGESRGLDGGWTEG